MLFGHINPIFFAVVGLIVAGCIFSLWKGASAERFGGAIVLANLLAAMLIGNARPLGSEPVAELVVDALTAMALLGVVLVYGSLWLGGAMLLYSVQFTLHAFYSVTERAPDRLHAVVNNLDSLGIIVCLVVGTAVAWRRRARTAIAIPA
jgi:hypothetical protein